ncbi:hypothetical protein SAY87_025505 [Trapa incisa]|uniref:Uncharacterized protein n=1 Tax=Trapa incisa TaxID=236973 RepID=A0AAN7GMG8_9MYRT|nr:hypothetical protein SAY87_025505 [Trapa incisa]
MEVRAACHSSGHCKIRKRGCSSSSSSSLVRRYRLKKAILVGKRTGSSTPVPTWKVGGLKSPAALVIPNSSSLSVMGDARGKKGVPVPVSARKLGATLWEINEVPSPVKETPLEEKAMERRREKPLLSNPSYSSFPEVPEGGKHRRRSSAAADYIGDGGGGGPEDTITNTTVIEMESHLHGKNRGQGSAMDSPGTRLKDLINSLTTAKELLKVLYRVGGLKKQQSSTVSLLTALRTELDRAFTQAGGLVHESRAYQTEIRFMTRRFAEEKAAWKAKERDRVRNAIARMAEELEVERKLRRQTERLNKKLGKELMDMKGSLTRAVKELEGERRAKEVLEQVCDELASGVGEDRAVVEELKRESAKVLEEVEKEREMLQLADVLREERVQMKLSEAKYLYEEKNAAVERLRSELEKYLKAKTGNEDDDNGDLVMSNYSISKDGDEANGGDVEEEESEGDGNGSADSDLHSIELNMDNTRSYKWSYGEGIEAQDPTKRDSLDKELTFHGRRSLSERIHWASISLKRDPSESEVADTELRPKSSENLTGFDRGRLLEFVSQAQGKNREEDESKRHKAIKGLKDSIMSSLGLASLQTVASPVRRWGPVQHPTRIEPARISSECECECGTDLIKLET